MIQLQRIESILARLPQLRIGLLGDLFLDRYLDIDRANDEPSIETGLTAYQVGRIRNSPGALGTVLNNLSALGAGMLRPVSVIGDDGHGFDLLRSVAGLGSSIEHVVRCPHRVTPTYTKPLREDDTGAWRELNRLDFRTRSALDAATQDQLNEHLSSVFADVDGLIVLDQINEPEWGVVNRATRSLLSELHDQQPDKLIFIDSRAHIQDFDCGTLKPNHAECVRAVGGAPTSDRSVICGAAESLAAKNGQTVFCTLGQDGMFVVTPPEAAGLVPTFPAAGPIDIVGAGDSATAGIVSALLCGAPATEAAAFGNLIASITVQQLGTTGTAQPEQVRAPVARNRRRSRFACARWRPSVADLFGPDGRRR